MKVDDRNWREVPVDEFKQFLYPLRSEIEVHSVTIATPVLFFYYPKKDGQWTGDNHIAYGKEYPRGPWVCYLPA